MVLAANVKGLDIYSDDPQGYQKVGYEPFIPLIIFGTISLALAIFGIIVVFKVRWYLLCVVSFIHYLIICGVIWTSLRISQSIL